MDLNDVTRVHELNVELSDDALSPEMLIEGVSLLGEVSAALNGMIQLVWEIKLLAEAKAEGSVTDEELKPRMEAAFKTYLPFAQQAYLRSGEYSIRLTKALLEATGVDTDAIKTVDDLLAAVVEMERVAAGGVSGGPVSAWEKELAKTVASVEKS